MITYLFLESTKRCFIVRFRRWFDVDNLTLFRRWLSFQRWYKDLILKHHDMRTNLFSVSTQNQCCFNNKFYRWINVHKSTLTQRGRHVDGCRDVISIYINVESTLCVCWAALLVPLVFFHSLALNISYQKLLSKDFLDFVAYVCTYSLILVTWWSQFSTLHSSAS